MPWNIYDQAHRVSYPEGGADYWQRYPDESLLNIRQPLVDHGESFTKKINDFGPADYLCCVYADATHCHLIRVHNGGNDNKGRPQRHVYVVWSQSMSPHAVLDFRKWVHDPAWPVHEPVPLPPVLPTGGYSIMPLAGEAAPDADDSQLGKAQSSWSTWLDLPDRATIGWIIFGEFQGTWLCHESLELRASVTEAAVPSGESMLHTQGTRIERRSSRGSPSHHLFRTLSARLNRACRSCVMNSALKHRWNALNPKTRWRAKWFIAATLLIILLAALWIKKYRPSWLEAGRGSSLSQSSPGFLS